MMSILSETCNQVKLIFQFVYYKKTKGDCNPGSSKELENVKLNVTPRAKGVIES